MIIKAEKKFIKIAPRKLRLIADMVRKMSIEKAMAILPHLNKRGAKPFLKVIQTAVANAKQAGFGDDVLSFESVQISDGPKLKRFRPVSKGRAHSYMRRMSHIRIELKTQK